MPHELILVVDDNKTGLALTRMILLAAGFVVLTAESAEQALDVLADPGSDLPALIVLDINLPGMTGLELCKQMRGVGCQIPILAYTAYGKGDWRYAQQAYQAGCTGFAEKSGDIDLLPRLIRQHLPEGPDDPELPPPAMPTAKGTH